MGSSDTSLPSEFNQVIDTEVNNEPGCGMERTNAFSVRKGAAEPTLKSVKTLQIMPGLETGAGKLDCNEGYNVIDISGDGEESAKDIRDAFEEEGAFKKIKMLDSEVGKSSLIRNPLARKMTVALDETEFSSVDGTLIDLTITSTENTESLQFEAQLNGPAALDENEFSSVDGTLNDLKITSTENNDSLQFEAELNGPVALDESEFSSVDGTLIDSKITSTENTESLQFEALLNGPSCSRQSVKITKEISESRKRLACDTVENAAKKKKTSVNSPRMTENSLMAVDELDGNNIMSVDISLSSKTERSSDSEQSALHPEVVNEVSSSKDSIFNCQPVSSCVDRSLLKYFCLNKEICKQELTKSINYLSKLCPKEDTFALFFGNPERTLTKQLKAPNSLASDGHAFLSNLENKSKCEILSAEADGEKGSKSVLFQKRKGNRAYYAERSYKNVGKNFITNDDLASLILEWNTSWLSTQYETKKCAPICDKYNHVKDRYVDELDYYNIYFPLHLLSIWLSISDSWKKNTATFDSVFVTETELINSVKVTCYTALNPDRWLKHEDILLCTALKPGEGVKELFGRICNVTYTDCETDDVYCGTSSRLKKVTFQFLCAEALGVPNLITLKIQILGNIRTALLQNDALQCLKGVTKDPILDPENHRSSIDFITLYPRQHEAFSKCKNDIINSIMSSDVHVTVVEALVPLDSNFITLQLAVTLMKKNRPVLIGVSSVDTLIDLATALKHFNMILAVKRSEVRLPDILRKFTLGERCALFHREVFFKCPVTLTLLSDIYVGDLGDALAEQQLTCIMPEAHLCTETESTLLLYYNVRHLVLMGRNERNPKLPSPIKRFGYDISLFTRLYKAK